MQFKNSTLMLALLATVAGSEALAAVPIYDNFSSTNGIDNTKWQQTGERRIGTGRQLELARRLLGGATSDAGVVAETYGLNLIDGTPPKSLSADITPTADGMETVGCASNPTPSFSRARLAAAYFNALKAPVAGDRSGDVIAQVRIGRSSDSVAPAGVLTVAGVLSQCTNADCSSSSVIGTADFGTTTTGTKVNARIDWLKGSKTFRFTLDGATVKEVTYTGSHANAPIGPFVQVALRNEAANCLSGPRVRTGFEATFDNVRLAR